MKKIVGIESLLSIDEMLQCNAEAKKSFLWNLVTSGHFVDHVSNETAIVIEPYEYDQIQKMNEQQLNEALLQLKNKFSIL